mgnify:FL=1
MKKWSRLLILVFLISALILTACGAPEAAPVEEVAAPAEVEAPAAVEALTGKICIALDSGGVDDKG